MSGSRCAAGLRGRMEQSLRFKDEKMESYWRSLPLEIQTLIDSTGIEISSPGMLEKLGEYYRGDSALFPNASDSNTLS